MLSQFQKNRLQSGKRRGRQKTYGRNQGYLVLPIKILPDSQKSGYTVDNYLEIPPAIKNFLPNAEKFRKSDQTTKTLAGNRKKIGLNSVNRGRRRKNLTRPPKILPETANVWTSEKSAQITKILESKKNLICSQSLPKNLLPDPEILRPIPKNLAGTRKNLTKPKKTYPGSEKSFLDKKSSPPKTTRLLVSRFSKISLVRNYHPGGRIHLAGPKEIWFYP